MVTSVTEAEYCNLSDGAKQLFIRRLLKFVSEEQDCTIVYNDNNGAVNLSKDWTVSDKTKHIDTDYHHVRELVEDGVVQPTYVPGDENVAHLLASKVIKTKESFYAMRNRLVVQVPQRMRWVSLFVRRDHSLALCLHCASSQR